MKGKTRPLESRVSRGLSGKVAVIAAAVIRSEDRILVWTDYNPDTGETVAVPPAGHVEFGEKGEETIRRELQEELQATAQRVDYVGLIEDIFDWAGQRRHEIYLIYDVDLAKRTIYGAKDVQIEDDDERYVARWRSLTDFDSETRLVPYGLRELIADTTRNTESVPPE